MSDYNRHTHSPWGSNTQRLPWAGGLEAGLGRHQGSSRQRREDISDEVKQAWDSFVPAQGVANPGTGVRDRAGDSGVQRKEFRPEHEWGRRWGAC